VAAEGDAARRAAWREDAGRRDARRFVFVDESSTTIALTRRYGRAPKGERPIAAAPRNHGTPTSVVAAPTPGGPGPAMTRSGAIDTPAFVASVREPLGPTLEPGQVVALDNLSAHEAEAVRSRIEGRGCEPLFLPPYSPDFSPSAHASSQLKAIPREIGARTQDALAAAIGLALDRISPEDARAFFTHCGYRLPAVS
jgi:transposase